MTKSNEDSELASNDGIEIVVKVKMSAISNWHWHTNNALMHVGMQIAQNPEMQSGQGTFITYGYEYEINKLTEL